MITRFALSVVVVLAGCATTSTVHQQHMPGPARVYAYTFEAPAGDDLDGIARLASTIHGRLGDAGLLAVGDAAAGRVVVTLTHFYVRSNVARSLAGILAGRDRIVSQVTVFDAAGVQIGHFEVETTNLTSWGSRDALMARHADEIVARLKS